MLVDFFSLGKYFVQRFSIFISARILVSVMNSWVWMIYCTKTWQKSNNIDLSELDTNKKQNKNNQAKCWFIGLYRIVSWHQEQKAWPDTLIFRMQSLTDISNSRILPKTNLFLLSLPTISRTSICFSRMRQFPTQMFSRLFQVRYERKRFTNSWWAAFPVKSFKAAVINFKFAEHSWCNYKMAANPPRISKQLTCKWRLGYFPSL